MNSRRTPVYDSINESTSNYEKVGPIHLGSKTIDQSTSNYEKVEPIHLGSKTIDSLDPKINELLLRVRRMESVILTQSLPGKHSSHKGMTIDSAVPMVPRRPPKLSRSTKSEEENQQELKPGSSSSELLPPYQPPLPPKSAMQRGNFEKTFSKSHCDYLLVQLCQVRDFIDEVVDDDFDEKREHIQMLREVMKTLTFRRSD